MLHDVVAVEADRTGRLRLRFDDGAQGEVDLRRLVPFEGVFEPLRDPDFFQRATVDSELGTVVWPNGADLAPEVLYEWATAGADGCSLPGASTGPAAVD